MSRKIQPSEWVRRIADAHGTNLIVKRQLGRSAVCLCTKHQAQFKATLYSLSKGRSGCAECEAEKYRAAKLKNSLKRIQDRLSSEFAGKISLIGAYSGLKEPARFSCSEHGEFKTKATYALSSKYICPKCADANRGMGKAYKSKSLFDTRVKELVGFKFGSYRGSGVQIPVLCLKHRVKFKIYPSRLTQRDTFVGCPDCISEYRQTLFTKTKDQVAAEIHEKHQGKIELVGEYLGTRQRHTFRCLVCNGTWQTIPDSIVRTKSSGCPHCVAEVSVSQGEQELFDWVRGLFPDAQQSVRKVYKPGSANALEWDVYIPSKKFAIEYNGLYFHSYPRKDKKYHWEKTQLSREIGVRLVHVYEDDWKYRTALVKKTLKHLLGVSNLRYYARDFRVSCRASVSVGIARFYNKNHLLGAPVRGITYGLLHGNILYSAMTFSPIQSKRGELHREGVYELTRFATKGHVVGAASRLFSAFVKAYNPSEIVSYSDNDMFGGDMYEMLGFTRASDVRYDYTTVWHGRRRHKSYTRRANLAKLLGDKFDPSKSEMQNLLDNNIRVIFNSGRVKWLWQS